MSSSDQKSRYELGKEKVAEITGDEGVGIVDSLGDLGRYIIEFAYGDIYNRPGLSTRERQVATIAVLTAMGREAQLTTHMRSALRGGTTVQELQEIILHTILYAGFPTAINAWRILQRLSAEADESKDKP